MGSSSTTTRIPSYLTESEIEFIKSNTNLSHNEICEWYRVFYEFTDGKKLTERYFIKYYKDLLPYKGDTEEYCKLIFKAFDTNNTSYLDFYELISGFMRLYNGNVYDHLEMMFRVYDQNNDDYIDFRELKSAFKAILCMADKEYKKRDDEVTNITKNVLKSLDKNYDEKISLEEFMNGVMNNNVLRNLMCPRY